MAQDDDQFRLLTVIKLLDDATGQSAKLLKSFHSEIQFRRSGIARRSPTGLRSSRMFRLIDDGALRQVEPDLVTMRKCQQSVRCDQVRVAFVPAVGFVNPASVGLLLLRECGDEFRSPVV